MYKTVLVVILVSVLLGCRGGATGIKPVNPSLGQNKTSPKDQLELEEFAVYDLVINSRCIRHNAQFVVIQEETSLSKDATDSLTERLKYVHEKLPQIEQAVLDDFSSRNNEKHKLKDRFNLRVKHVIAGNEVLEPLSQTPDFWGAFYKKFPGAQGMVSLSRVGFNNETNLALVYVGTASGPDIGAGHYMFLSKKQDRWAIVNDVQVWSV